MDSRARTPNVVDLFCGAGGMSLGFHRAGYRIALAIDTDEKATRTFSENFSVLQPDAPPCIIHGTAANLEHLDLERLSKKHRADVLIGGPPCQAFSRIGRAKLQDLSQQPFHQDPRLSLYKCFLDAVSRWKPRAFVMENVPGMLTVDGSNLADDVADEMSELGYIVKYALLNAAWYGVPQLRERLFFIGFQRDLGIRPAGPRRTHLVTTGGGYIHRDGPENQRLPGLELPRLFISAPTTATAARPISTHEALGDLPQLFDHLENESPRTRRDFRQAREYPKADRTEYATLMREWPGFPAASTVDDHEIRRTPRDFETFRRMQPGDRYPRALEIARKRLEEAVRKSDRRLRPGSDAWKRRENELEKRFVPPYPDDGYVDKWRKLDPDQPSWTVTAHLSKDSYSHIHYEAEQARAISVREAARLQSFPDRFKFYGNMGDCFRQIGNAVPPLLAEAIARQLKAQLEPEDQSA